MGGSENERVRAGERDAATDISVTFVEGRPSSIGCRLSY